jgi:hypothetical protein
MWQQVQLDAEQTYIDNEAARKDGVYKVEQIGLVEVGAGHDRYILVTDPEEGFRDKTSKQIVWQWANDKCLYEKPSNGRWASHPITILKHYTPNSVIVVVHNRVKE